jgi:hypothetical protein
MVDMTRKSLFLLVGVALFTSGLAQGRKQPAPGGPGTPVPAVAPGTFPLRSLPHTAFKPGEKLTYVLHYGFVNAGEATLELRETDMKMLDRPMLQAVGKGRSLGAFNTFYKVNDHYETYFDRDGVFPWIFMRRVSEGGYEFSQDYAYLQNLHQVNTQKKQTHAVPAHVQDMLSAFYYARTIDYSKAKPGDEFSIDCFLDDEIWPLKMRYVGKETIKLRSGKYRCLKFQPVVQQGRIFKTNDDLNVWVTDDANHIPVLAQAKVLVGSIKMELSSYEGLMNPVAKE